MRGSPSLVGRGIANSMFARTRGFESPSPRLLQVNLKMPNSSIFLMTRRKTQKIIKTGPKNVTTGMCPECKTIGRIFIIGSVGNERAKCPSCNQIFDL